MGGGRGGKMVPVKSEGLPIDVSLASLVRFFARSLFLSYAWPFVCAVFESVWLSGGSTGYACGSNVTSPFDSLVMNLGRPVQLLPVYPQTSRRSFASGVIVKERWRADRPFRNEGVFFSQAQGCILRGREKYPVHLFWAV